jgi:acetoin utilization deacetylase AcuC-like enzyme
MSENSFVGSIPHAYYRREERLTGVVLMPSQELHDTGEHPENVWRLPPVYDYLQNHADWEQLFALFARNATDEDFLRSHDEAYVELIKSACTQGPIWLDTDTKVNRESLTALRLATGAVLNGVDAVSMEAYHRPDSLFALMRPCGHHASADRAMGFCIFNHASIAARYAQKTYGFERIAIVDWDVHHGNGTQAIHEDDPSVLFFSFHQWPLYPGSGWFDEIGTGEGVGYTVNLPMPERSGDREYLQGMEEVVLPVLRSYSPQLLIISAGQDCHAAETLGNQTVSAMGFRRMAEVLADFGHEQHIGIVAVLEGGYNTSTLPVLVHSILAGLGGFEGPSEDPFVPQAPPVGWPERLNEILAVQRSHWECLR